MKPTNVSVVGELYVNYMHGVQGLVDYTAARKGMSESDQMDWLDMEALPEDLRGHFQFAGHLSAFSVSVVRYDIPSDTRHGLNRPQAQSILRSLNLNPLSTRQTFQLASSTIYHGWMKKTSDKNEGRVVAVTVPINPELPKYFYFGKGFRGKGSFRHMDYERALDGDKLYFWFNPDEDPSLSHPATHLNANRFPLLIGVRGS